MLVASSIPDRSSPPPSYKPRKIAFGPTKRAAPLGPAWVSSSTTEGILRRQPLPPSPSLSPKPSIISLNTRAGLPAGDSHLDCPHRPDSDSRSPPSSDSSDRFDLPDPAMEHTAPLSDLHLAATYISGLLRAYHDPEAGFVSGSGIPHAFAGSWEVRALSEGLGGASEGAGDGYEVCPMLESFDVIDDPHRLADRKVTNSLSFGRKSSVLLQHLTVTSDSPFMRILTTVYRHHYRQAPIRVHSHTVPITWPHRPIPHISLILSIWCRSLIRGKIITLTPRPTTGARAWNYTVTLNLEYR